MKNGKLSDTHAKWKIRTEYTGRNNETNFEIKIQIR